MRHSIEPHEEQLIRDKWNDLMQTVECHQKSQRCPSSPITVRTLVRASLSFQTHLLPVVQSSSKETIGDLLSWLPVKPVIYGVQEILDQRPAREVLQVGRCGKWRVNNNSTEVYSLTREGDCIEMDQCRFTRMFPNQQAPMCLPKVYSGQRGRDFVSLRSCGSLLSRLRP